ncbi:CRIB domain-containing protein RIC7-like isoform X1 [Phoenix dactylifera]|uniref:CRIB domain-containing protein RIC7-like isoform X1 n=1 Tax=Phoenix dactylifera TaxID=42345 RepID=A0A8B9AEJ2_PHODC|nr:CRIB domain-containing protein RIC7-like isoform X1 [Phoenix dactylifera]
MKRGFLKPLRYISQMFDGKEPEMQIGFPTDVKHVAHIGWDGPNMNAPGWMKDFHSAPIGTIGSNECRAGMEDNPSGEMMPRGSRRSGEPTVGDSPNNAPRHRHSRRHQSEGTVSVDSLNREPPSDGSRRGSRRPRKKDGDSAAAAGGDLPAIPKQSRRRSKGSGSSGSGDSIRASRSKNPASASSDNATQERDARPPSPAIRKPAAEGEDYLI